MQNLSAQDFYQPCKWNPETKNQVWMSEIADAHDNFCGCPTPFAHLLASIFPPGHRDRNNTIQQILDRDYTECHSGGTEGESHGLAGGGTGGGFKGIKEDPEEEGEDLPTEEIDALIAAAENIDER